MKIFTLILFFTSFLLGQNYFNPVQPTGLPYSIVVKALSINGSPATQIEIAVFEDTLCVGSGIFYNDSNIVITAWKGDVSNNLPGFVSGHPIIYKGYSIINGTGQEIELSGNYEIGNGTYGFGIMSVVRLFGNTTGIKQNEEPKRQKSEIEIYPNPFNMELMIDLKWLRYQNKSIQIFDIMGKIVKEIRNTDNDYFIWNSRDNNNQIVTTGIYFIVVSTTAEKKVKQVLLLK